MKRLHLLVFLGAFLLRIVFLLSAHHGDLNNNISWGQILVERGSVGYYEGKVWPYSAPNQPPLTILMFGGLMYLYSFIEKLVRDLNNSYSLFPSQFIWFWEQHGKDILVKIPSVLADLAIGYLIYKYFVKLKRGVVAVGLSALWLFNPVIWFNSSIWGQTDSIVNLVGLLGVLALTEKKLLRSTIWFTLSILFKGSLFVLAPVLLFFAVGQKYSIKIWIKAALVSIVIMYFICLPFYPSITLPVWLYNLYINQFLPGEIGFLTANAFNFWWLVDSGKTLDSNIYLGLSARIWGFLLSITGIVVLLNYLRNKLDNKSVFLALSVSALITFLFMTRIHERYLYPFFPTGTIVLGFMPQLLIPYILLSLVHVFNLFHLFPMPWQIDLKFLYNINFFVPLLAMSNLALLLWIIKVIKKYT